MEINLTYKSFKIYFIELKDICIKVLKHIEKTKKIEDQNVHTDTNLGNVSYKIKDEIIEITFSNVLDKVEIFKNPIIFKDNENKEVFKAFNEKLLNYALNSTLNKYEFYVGGTQKTMEEIIKLKPQEIILKEKFKSDYEIFKKLNIKKDLPKAKTTTININDFLPGNIETLGLKRNTKIKIIIEQREELINEINNFFLSKDKILKIYGCDGIGKSVTFVYLQSLKKNYSTIYFNLKEFELSLTNKQKVDKFKKQLLTYFSLDCTNVINNMESLNKLAYKEYEELIKNLKLNEDNNCIYFDFWILLNLLINDLELDNVLIILDQFKSENEEKKNLDKFVQKIIEKDEKTIKLLVAYSINDSKVKYDFLNILKSLKNENIQKNNKIKSEDDNIIKNERFDHLLDLYDEKTNYIDENQNNEDEKLFEKIKEFNSDKDQMKINNNENNNNINNNDDNLESDIKDKKCINNDDKTNNFSNDIKNEYLKEINLDNKTRIIYINKLVSAENLINEDNKELIEKMKEFDFNIKYLNKFIAFSNVNQKSKLDERYDGFMKKIYIDIKKKIKKFYDNYYFQFHNFEKTAVNYLIILLDAVKNEKYFVISELIDLLENLPIKYVKIYKIDNNNNNNNFILLDKDLINYRFRLDYVFPFIEFVIRRYIYETGIIGDINFSGLTPSGIGSLLEIEVKRGLMQKNNSFIFCNHRTVWGFEFSKKTNLDKKDLCYKYDIYNFKKLVLDDEKSIKDRSLDYNMSYYITPYKKINEYLDSIFLINSPFNHEENKEYSLISTQMTINKEKIYDLEEYHDATEIAAKVMEDLYNIKITNKYFIFILAKGYENIKTQLSLIEKKIPFIFFSTTDYKFYFDEKILVKGINELLINKYKVLSNKEKVQQEFIYNKSLQLNIMHDLLNKKRERENYKITKNLYCFARKKLFEDSPISNINNVKKKLLDNIRKIELYKEKKVIFQFSFKCPFSEINNLSHYNEFIGIFAYSNHLIAFYNNNNIFDLYSENMEKKKNKENIINKVILMIFQRNDLSLDENVHNFTKKEKNEITIEELVKYNLNKPSDIFVYKIFEIN